MKRLKALISSNKFLYIIWFYIFLKKKNKDLKLPKRGDSLYFDGYPRSGNTYTFGLIYRVYPSLHCNVSHHLHSVIALKMALSKNIKSIIIIRHPKNAIISYLFSKRVEFLKDSGVADELISQYVSYYDFVNKNLKDIRIINFDRFITNEKMVLQNIENYTGHTPQINMYNHVDGFIDFDDFLMDYKNRMNNFQKVQNSNLSSMPNEERKKFKIQNIEKILKSDNYPKAIELYNEIIKSNSIL